ncbi:MAG: serine/threonine protein kinase [bacterium]|nr:serine/threonine protein kinase [bacterium]
MEGKTIGNYHIGRKLGEGGMGSVYLARDLSLERNVALKIIAPQLARNPQLMARFRVEAIAQARLNHTNIVTIHSFDQQENAFYIVMEYVEGKTLKALIDEAGKIPPDQALKIVSLILQGLMYAHAQGVFHRDIKPANIFLTTEGEAKIGDFGIAKVEGIDGLTRVGSVIGTPLYSSPEQILGQKIDATTDIYSLGVTLYEMVTGSTPFKSDTGNNFSIQQAHLNKIPQKPSQLNGSLSPEMDALIMKTLDKTPAQRYPDAGTFKQAVDKLAGIRTGETGGGNKAGFQLQRLLSRMSESNPIKNIKTPKLSFSIFKGKRLSPDVPVFKRLSPIISRIRKLDRRKQLLIILIPLIILLFIVIAYS